MNNIIMIGMPGSGKSTLGVLIAKMTGKDFLDTDVGLQKALGMKLSEYIKLNGLGAFRKAEDEYLRSLNLNDTVIATGGSAVYYDGAMCNLKASGTVVYLKVPFEQIQKRVGDLVKRGVVIEKGQTFKDLYDQRAPLYEKYADVTVDESNLDVAHSATKIVELLNLD